MIEIFDAEHIVATPLMQYKVRPATPKAQVIETEDMNIFEDLPVAGTRLALVSSTRATGERIRVHPASFSYYARGLQTGLEPCAFASSDEDRKRLELCLLNMQLYADAEAEVEAEAAARETKAARAKEELRSGDVRRSMLSPFGLDRRTGLSSKEFREVHDGAWPVLLADCARDWHALSRWRRDRLLERFGDREWLAVESLVEGEYSIIEMEHTSVRELERRANVSRHLLASDASYFAHSEGFELSSCAPLRENLLRLWPDSARPPTAVLQWGSQYSRSNLQVLVNIPLIS